MAEENSEDFVPTWGIEMGNPPLFRRQNGRIRVAARPQKRCDLVFAGTNNGKRLHGARDSDEERVIRRGGRDASVKMEPRGRENGYAGGERTAER